MGYYDPIDEKYKKVRIRRAELEKQVLEKLAELGPFEVNALIDVIVPVSQDRSVVAGSSFPTDRQILGLHILRMISNGTIHLRNDYKLESASRSLGRERRSTPRMIGPMPG